jgi:putative redox protein
MPVETIRFEGSLGHELAGVLETPHGTPRACALFAHCFTCSKDLKAAYWISKALVDRQMAVLRFDFTGLGDSQGDFADTNFTSNLEDLVAAADAMRERLEAPQLLVGHSLGGAAVVRVADRIDAVRAVATLGAPSDTRHLAETLTRQAPELRDRGEADVSLGGRTLRLTRQLLDDLSEDHLSDGIGRLGRALLVLHSPVDRTVDIEHARRLYQAAKHPKSFVSLDDADHLLSRERDARYAADLIATWAERYLPEREAPEEAPAPRDEGEVVASGPGVGFVTRLRAGRHRQMADEPPKVGGTDMGPTPYDYLLAGLGACTSMTIRLYARKKAWPLEGVDVRLSHERVHAADCDACETQEGRVDQITKEVTVYGDGLTAEQKQRLVEIGERCPVHRTLTSETRIVSEKGRGTT